MAGGQVRPSQAGTTERAASGPASPPDAGHEMVRGRGIGGSARQPAAATAMAAALSGRHDGCRAGTGRHTAVMPGRERRAGWVGYDRCRRHRWHKQRRRRRRAERQRRPCPAGFLRPSDEGGSARNATANPARRRQGHRPSSAQALDVGAVECHGSSATPHPPEGSQGRPGKEGQGGNSPACPSPHGNRRTPLPHPGTGPGRRWGQSPAKVERQWSF